MRSKIRLNAPAGNLPALIAAVGAGADSVYIGFRSPTNLRNLPGLNFSVEEAAEGVEYARQRGVKVHVAVNTHPLDHQLDECLRAVDEPRTYPTPCKGRYRNLNTGRRTPQGAPSLQEEES